MHLSILVVSLLISFTAAVTSKMKLLVPLYFNPMGDSLKQWQQVGNATQKVNIISIINLDGGPDIVAKNDTYIKALTQLKTQNQQNKGSYSIGYVLFANRSISDVQADIVKYSKWPKEYRLNGVFIDKQSTNKSLVANYYTQIYNYTKTVFNDSNALVVSNMQKTFPVEFFCSDGLKNNKSCLGKRVLDIGVAFEGNYESWESNHDLEPYMTSYLNSTQLAAMVYDCSNADDMKEMISDAIESNIGYVYVTDQTALDKKRLYSRLPVYFKDEVDYIASLK